jgi:diaminopropionate ammonia-lyase
MTHYFVAQGERDVLHLNSHPDHRTKLAASDAACLDQTAADDVALYLSHRRGHRPTPVHVLPSLAAEARVGAICVKDEAARFGMGSFKALGGAYAVVRLVLEAAALQLGRKIAYDEMESDAVRRVASAITLSCATDGNHGRSVAQGAQLVGARCSIFVHAGVSELRISAIADLGADIIRVGGTYDDSVLEAARVSEARGWLTVSDTSWPGYERVPGLVMQGYVAMVDEAMAALPLIPTHVFVQAGVGGLAAAVAGRLALTLGVQRPKVVVVEPRRAACLFETARAGKLIKILPGEPTVMAMLECYEPSLLAWRVLSRTADAFMTVDEDDAIASMNLFARPRGADPVIVAGESGGVGLAGFLRVADDPSARERLELDANARVLVFNTEGATDPSLYRRLVGLDPTALSRRDVLS